MSEQIVIDVKNLTKQYKKLFEIDGIKLEFTDEAIIAFAKKAIELKTGARGLRTILESAMLPVMYTTPSKKDSISKIIMDVESKDSTNVVPTIIEKTISEKPTETNVVA